MDCSLHDRRIDRAPSRRLAPRHRPRPQSGQALIYGMFFLVVGLAALFFLFNSGQLTAEKTKLVNTSDAVAYSAGVMHARALNFDAYTNRAMVANTVAIAQMVSLSSWIQHVDNMSRYGFVLQNPKFSNYQDAYDRAKQDGPSLQSDLNASDGTLERLAKGSDRIVRDSLMTAQQVAAAGMVSARQRVMDDVAAANYRDDGSVQIDLLPQTVQAFEQFAKRYEGNDRGRFAEVARTAAKLDRFVPRRDWILPAQWSDCATAPTRDWLDRRGGTDLVGFDEWKALDTLAEKRWVPAHMFDVSCRALIEIPAAWGGRTAGDSSDASIDLQGNGGTWLSNPVTTVLATASSESWDYTGLPSFYELTDAARNEPRLRFAVRVRRDVGDTRTSAGRSDVRPSERLNAYAASAAGGNELVAVSVAEVFFERPHGASDNVYGADLSDSRPVELGSLFNPFWQVRLVQDAAIVNAAQAMQGAVLP